ncbi:MAG: UpxY family transcription antiterminator [Saprospiraceae bacterium]|nr:UpxY family transcription antiterminator [Saprospiraceae bacterium]
MSTDKKRWFAVYTKYKCEKYVSDILSKKQIASYVPIVSKTKKYNRKVKHYEVPLINCYVFVYIDKKEYLPILETEYVMKFLKQGKDLLAIPESEIEVLRRVSGDVIDVSINQDLDFIYGQEVEVISGHLAGMRGKIVSKSSKRCFVIDLETIGYQLRIKVDFNLLRPMYTKQLIA